MTIYVLWMNLCESPILPDYTAKPYAILLMAIGILSRTYLAQKYVGLCGKTETCGVCLESPL
jgi:hypothetical protein